MNLKKESGFKKNLEIVLYLLIELGLAYLLVSSLNIDERVLPIVGAVFVYLGKIIIKKTKDVLPI